MHTKIVKYFGGRCKPSALHVPTALQIVYFPQIHQSRWKDFGSRQIDRKKMWGLKMLCQSFFYFFQKNKGLSKYSYTGLKWHPYLVNAIEMRSLWKKI